MLRRSLRALSTPSHTVVDGEDRFMKQAIRFIEAWPTPPRTVIEVVHPVIARSSSHRAIARWKRGAHVRIVCYTHADRLGDAQIASLASAAEADDPSAALFFLGVPDADQVKPKALGALRRAILGAIASTDANRALVCGLPNVGALATRLPRARVERVRACVSACAHGAQASRALFCRSRARSRSR